MSMLEEFSNALDKRREGNRPQEEDNTYALHKWDEKKSKYDGKKDDRNKYDKRDNRNDSRDDKRDDRGYKNDNRNDDKNSKGGSVIGIVEAASQKYIDSKINTVNDLEVFGQKLSNPKFAEKLGDALKVMEKNGSLDKDGPIIGAMMFELMLNNRNKIKGELEDTYIEMIDDLLKPRVSELADKMKKRHRPSKTILREIAIVLPTDDIIDVDKNLFSVVAMINEKLYAQADEWFKKGKDEDLSEEVSFTTKGIYKLFDALYGEENLTKVAIGCLLEKRDKCNKISNKSGKELWNTITTFALETLNEVEDIRELDRLLGSYTYTRYLEFETDSGRRVILRDVDDEEYSQLAKAIRKLSKDERIAGRLG